MEQNPPRPVPSLLQLSKGGTLAQTMSKKALELEEMMEKLEETKKDPSNKEFVKLMSQLEKASARQRRCHCTPALAGRGPGGARGWCLPSSTVGTALNCWP